MSEVGMATTPNEAKAPARGFRLPVWNWLMLWMALFVGGPVALHATLHGGVNGWHALLAFFLAINIAICVWEISLYFRIDDIERWHHGPREGNDRPRGSLYTTRVAPGELLSTRLWARVWSEYAFYDPSYADRRSFGFAIDVGNGFSTLIPSLVFLAGMTFPFLSPVVLGLIGAFIFYQKFYGTCLYFFTYLFNRRYQGHRLGSVIAMVGGTNGVWLFFPAIGLYVCLRLILENRFDVIQ